MRFRKPSADPRSCSSRPLMASVGRLLVPGRSKYDSTSAADNVRTGLRIGATTARPVDHHRGVSKPDSDAGEVDSAPVATIAR